MFFRDIKCKRTEKINLPTTIFPHKAESDKKRSLLMNQKKSFGHRQRYDAQQLTLSQNFMSPKMSILLDDTLGFWCDEQVPGGRYIRPMGTAIEYRKCPWAEPCENVHSAAFDFRILPSKHALNRYSIFE